MGNFGGDGCCLLVDSGGDLALEEIKIFHSL
jgi:hypothetical protein